ncbi:hypothetical protein [Vibrio vulnificus]|uniref:hypothetical protein n=1 Tax=Vibrio vulnificus TaxID=672 RepID=UPI0028CF78A2|nr:hypothetical protein [Vibrio vulnificus]
MFIYRKISFILLLYFGVSFNAVSAFYYISSSNEYGLFCDLQVGDTIEFPSNICAGKVYQGGGYKFTIAGLMYCDGKKNSLCINSYQPHYIYSIASISNSAGCPDGQELNPETNKCEEPPVDCKELENTDAPQPPMLPPENGQPITATRLYCDTANMCEAARIYYNDQDTLTRSFVYTGHDCVGSESDYANNPWYGSHTDPDTPDPDQPLPDPEHNPDDPTGNIEDPSVLPDSSTGQVPVDPDPVEPEPDVPTPDPTPDSNGDVVQAVTNLNRDVNKTITSLNVDINAGNARLESELKGVNAKITDNTQAIVDLHKATKQAADNEKALLLGLNKDVTTAVNQVRNETASGLFGVKDAVNKLGDDLENLLSGNGRGFNTPSGSGDWDGNGKDGTLIGDSIDGIKGEIEVLEQDLKNLLQKSPINMGQMNFQQGSYTPESFVLKGQEVSFNLFGILKADKNMIQSVIIFLAFLTAAFIILSSGRSR